MTSEITFSPRSRRRQSKLWVFNDERPDVSAEPGGTSSTGGVVLDELGAVFDGGRAAFADLRDGSDKHRESSDELREGFSEGGGWVDEVREWFDEDGEVIAEGQMRFSLCRVPTAKPRRVGDLRSMEHAECRRHVGRSAIGPLRRRAHADFADVDRFETVREGRGVLAQTEV